jgi:hypothetical protein
MKIHRPSRPKSESGLVTLLFVVLLSIMMILITAESRSLYNLHRDVKLLEQQQVKRSGITSTNATTTVISRTP